MVWPELHPNLSEAWIGTSERRLSVDALPADLAARPSDLQRGAKPLGRTSRCVRAASERPGRVSERAAMHDHPREAQGLSTVRQPPSRLKASAPMNA